MINQGGVKEGDKAPSLNVTASDGFRLYVERDNANAQATYRALGMDTTDYLLMEEMREGVVYLQRDD